MVTLPDQAERRRKRERDCLQETRNKDRREDKRGIDNEAEKEETRKEGRTRDNQSQRESERVRQRKVERGWIASRSSSSSSSSQVWLLWQRCYCNSEETLDRAI